MTALAIVDAIVALCRAARLVRRNIVLPRRECDRIADQNHGQKHLAFIFRGRVVVGRRILCVVREVGAPAVHTWIRKAHVKTIFWPVYKIRLGLPRPVKEMLHYVVDLEILVLPQHALEFIHELLINHTVVDLFYFYNLSGASYSKSSRSTHSRRRIQHVHISNPKCRSVTHIIYSKPSRAQGQPKIVVFNCSSLLLPRHSAIKCRCEEICNEIVFGLPSTNLLLHVNLASFYGKLSWRLESSQVVPSLNFLLSLDLQFLKLLKVNKEVSDTQVIEFWTEQVIVGSLKSNVLCDIVFCCFAFMITISHDCLTLIIDYVRRYLSAIRF